MTNRITNGIAWVTISSILRNIVSILQLAILTRLLDKADFGVIAIAMLFVNFTQLFLDMGISAGIIHKQDVSHKEYSSLFWLNIIFGVILTIILYVISPNLTRSYSSHDLDNIVRLLSCTILINSFGNQQRIICQKFSLFKRLSIIEIATSIITLVVSAYSAYIGHGVYSIVYATISGLIFNNVTHLFYAIKSEYRPLLHFKIKDVIPFLKIGIYAIGSQILDFFTRELDIIVLSGTLGLEFVGIYNIAKKVCLAIYRFVTPILQKVFTPFFSELNNDIFQLRSSFIGLTRFISMFSMPIFFLLAVTSPTVIYYLFGNDYVSLGAPIQSVFAFMYAFNSFMGICGSLQVATGRTDIGLIWTIFLIVTTLVIYYLTSLLGIEYFLCGVIFKTIIEALFIWIIQFKKLIHISLSDYLISFSVPFLISLFMALPFIFIFYRPSMFVSVMICCIYLMVYIIILSKTSYKKEISFIISKIYIKKY